MRSLPLLVALLTAACTSSPEVAAPPASMTPTSPVIPAPAPSPPAASGPAVQACDVSSVQRAAQDGLAKRGGEGAVIAMDLRQAPSTRLFAVGPALKRQVPPASSVKPFVAWSARSAERVPAAWTHTCTGSWQHGRDRMSCHGEHGKLDLRLALATSCSTYFYELAHQLGPDNVAQGFERVGLTQLAKQVLASAKAGEKAFLATATGHGSAGITPDEIANAYAFVARDPSAASVDIREGLLAVVADPQGTGQAAAVEGLAVAGKTGTADEEGGHVHGWFSGYAPAHHPELLVVVYLQDQGSGGQGAASLAHDVLVAWQTTCLRKST